MAKTYVLQMQIFCNVVRQLSAKGQNYTVRLLKVIDFHHSLQSHRKHHCTSVCLTNTYMIT